MAHDESTTLSQKNNLRIVQFTCCGHIAFMYKNLLLNFNPDGFLDFSTAVQKLNFEKRSATFSDGMRRLVINTRQKEVQLCFKKSEFELVQEALREAAVTLEVNQIL